MGTLNIKYEDSEIILVVKPPGIATESRRIGEKDMVSMVKNYRAQKKEANYIGLIHRLDQPVGGLLLLAKTKEAASKLSSQLQSGTIEKYYQALLCGRIEREGRLTDYLIRDGKANLSCVTDKETPGAKRAGLTFRRLQTFSMGEKNGTADKKEEIGASSTEKNTPSCMVSLVEIKLETGRHHQIRVQMAHHGFPLLGDKKYGVCLQKECSSDNNQLDATYQERWLVRKQGLALFAWKLKFWHPKTGKWMEFTEEPDF